MATHATNQKEGITMLSNHEKLSNQIILLQRELMENINTYSDEAYQLTEELMEELMEELVN